MDSQVKDSRFSVWPRIVELPLLTCSGQTLLSLFSYFDEDGKDHNYERICLAFVVRVDINNYCTIQYNTIQYDTELCLRVYCGPVLVPSPGKGGGLVAGCRYLHR